MAAEYTTIVDGNVIRVSKVGGGTIGRKYSGDWEVTITRDATMVLDDIITTGVPMNHTDVAYLSLDFADDALEV